MMISETRHGVQAAARRRITYRQEQENYTYSETNRIGVTNYADNTRSSTARTDNP